MSDPLLSVAGLRSAYGRIEVVHGVSFTVAPGEVVSIIGANGAGKSTILRTIVGLMAPSEGEITVAGESVVGRPPHRILDAGVALVPEGRQLFPSLTVRENLRMGAFRRKDGDRTERVLELFPILAQRSAQAAGTLSGGEQQMLAIARGLMSEPRLLMLDEPSLGLAPVIVAEVIAAVEQLHSEGLSMLLVEQNVRQALEVSDRGYVIESGRIALEGSSDELLGDAQVKAAYLGL